jgi:hypothetical protein
MKNLLQDLNDREKSNLDLAYYYQEGQTFDEYMEALQDSINEQEIIYYSKALEYLRENDPSLKESLSIASEHCFSLDNLNSEVLATLLYQQELNDELDSYYEEIKEYFNN